MEIHAIYDIEFIRFREKKYPIKTISDSIVLFYANDIVLWNIKFIISIQFEILENFEIVYYKVFIYLYVACLDEIKPHSSCHQLIIIYHLS